MLKCYIDEDYLHNYEPELDQYMWQGETDFDNYKAAAVSEVFLNLNKLCSDSRYLMPELVLRSSGSTISANETGTSKIETINRNRIVIDVKVFTGSDSKTLILQGSSDSSTWVTINEYEITETGVISGVNDEVYNYYRINTVITDGTIDFKAYLVESQFDNLFAFKWLQKIFENQKKDEILFNVSKSYEKKYYEAMKNIFIYEDKNLDGYPEINS